MSCGCHAVITQRLNCRGKPSTPGRSLRFSESICEIHGRSDTMVRGPIKKSIRIVAELEELKRRFGAAPRELTLKLGELRHHEIDDAESLIRLHETLLFLRASPPSTSVLNQAEKILKTFAKRVSQLREAGIDLSSLDDPEVSGIAGT